MIAAIEQFLRDTVPPPAPPAEVENAWLRAARRRGHRARAEPVAQPAGARPARAFRADLARAARTRAGGRARRARSRSGSHWPEAPAGAGPRRSGGRWRRGRSPRGRRRSTSSPRNSSTASATRAWRSANVSAFGGTSSPRCQAATSSGSSSSSVWPAQSPMSISRQRGSVGAPPSPSSSAVCTARVRSEESRRAGMSSRNGSSAAACSRPSAESGGSAWPWSRCSAFQVDSPWRTIRRREVTPTACQRTTSNSCVRTPLRRGGKVERGAEPSERSRGSARSQARQSRVRIRTARLHGACDSRR